MGPVVQDVSERLRDRLGPSEKLLIRVRATGTVMFGHPIRPHCAPLVMVAFQADLKQVSKTPIVGDIPRRKVAMVIKDRLRTGVCAVEVLRRLAMQKKGF